MFPIETVCRLYTTLPLLWLASATLPVAPTPANVIIAGIFGIYHEPVIPEAELSAPILFETKVVNDGLV